MPRTITSLRDERDELGVIVTLKSQRTGKLFSLHVSGKRLDALRHIAAVIDQAEEDWRVICYSTPETIRQDLKGKREKRGGRYHDKDKRLADNVEAHALSRIGRKDLLDPSLYRSDQSHYRRR
jgi:hypothetical protein